MILPGPSAGPAPSLAANNQRSLQELPFRCVSPGKDFLPQFHRQSNPTEYRILPDYFGSPR